MHSCLFLIFLSRFRYFSSFSFTYTNKNAHTHTTFTNPLKARKAYMPIFLFDCVSTVGGRGTCVMHKTTQWLHHTRDSFMVRMCFNHTTALECINQYTHSHSHTDAHTTDTLLHVNTLISWCRKRAAECKCKFCFMHRSTELQPKLLLFGYRRRSCSFQYSWNHADNCIFHRMKLI